MMRKLKTLIGMVLLLMVMGLIPPQTFADGPSETPGQTVTVVTADGPSETPGFVIFDIIVTLATKLVV